MSPVYFLVLIASVFAEDIGFAPPASSAFAGIDPLIIAEAAYSPPAPESLPVPATPLNSPPPFANPEPAAVDVQYSPPSSDFSPQIVTSVASSDPVSISENIAQPQPVSSTPVFSVAYSPPSSAAVASSGDVSLGAASQQASPAVSATAYQAPQSAPVPAKEYGLPGGGYENRNSYYLNDGTVYTAQSSNNGNFQYSYYTPGGSSRTEIGSTKQLKQDEPPVVVYRGSYSYPTPDGKVVSIQYLADENGFLARPAQAP